MSKARVPIWEDFFHEEAAHLARFAAGIAGHWPAKWNVDLHAARAALLADLGDGLVRYLRDGTCGIVLAKTPSVVGLDHHADLFPREPLIVLVRDGRAVVRSAMRSFGWSFERAVVSWTDGAERVLAFDAITVSPHCGTGSSATRTYWQISRAP